MSVFPSTSTTLLQTLAAKNTGVSEAAWARFFELYTPAMRRFIEMNDHTHDPDDVIQNGQKRRCPAKTHGSKNRHDFPNIARKKKMYRFTDIIINTASFPYCFHNGCKMIIHQNHICRTFCDFCSVFPHGTADICRF